jgi:PAS domain S-box-containing protein
VETHEETARVGSEAGNIPAQHVDHSRLHLFFQNIYEILCSAPAVVVITDGGGFIEYVNPRFTEATGYSADEVIGHNVTEVAWDTPTQQDAWTALSAGRSWQGEIMFRRKDGGEYWAEASIQPVRTRDGTITRYIGIHVDITDQKRIERELAERAAYYEALGKSAPNLILTLAPDGTITSINREIGAATGAVVGRSAFDLVLPEWHDRWREALQNVFTNGLKQMVEIKARLPNGYVGWFANSIGPVMSDSQVTVAICVSHDISERVAMEEALKEREAYWRALVENAPEFIVSVDRDGVITNVNREVDGGRPDEAEGHTIFDFADEDAHAEQRKALERVFDKGETVELENRAALTSGEVRWWSYTIGPVRRDDRVVAAVLISHDITERKEAEGRLRRRESQWRALLENAPDYVLILDRDGAILRLNRAAQGTLPEEVIGHNVTEYAEENCHVEWQEALGRVFTAGSKELIECQSRNMGEPRWFAASIGPILDGEEVSAAVVVARDVTDRRLAEERLRAFATAVPDLIVVLDEEGTFVEVMRSPHGGLASTLGSTDELRGHSLSEFLTAEEVERVCAFIQTTIASSQPQETHGIFQLPAGQAWVTARAAPMTLPDGRRAAVMHVLDATESKRLEEELAALREEVEAKAEERHAKAAEFGLTFRELTVLGFIARGRSDKEIAALLGVSRFTVNKQSSSAVRKLGGRSRSEAVARAVRLGII